MNARLRPEILAEGAGATVRRLLPTTHQGPLDPFVFFDHFQAPAGTGFPDHPHRGFEAITYLLSGALRHTDNLGHDATLHAGEVQAFTAGRGMVHAERVEGEAAAVGLQLWVNLPRALKGIEPGYQSPARPRRVVAAGYALQLLTGPDGPIRLHTPSLIALLELAPGGSFTPAVPNDWRGLAYVLRGRLQYPAGMAGEGEGLPLEGGVSLSRAPRKTYCAGGLRRRFLAPPSPICLICLGDSLWGSLHSACS